MTEQLLADFEAEITEVILVPSDGGRFEITADGELLYSKKRTGRHAEYGEVAAAVREHLQRLP